MTTQFSFSFRIYIEDTDAGGIVYHANHIKYLERTRTEWLRTLGLAHYSVQDEFNLVVYALDIQYHKPILMNDLIEVTADLIQVKAASFTVKQQIWRDDQLLATAQVTIACVSKSLQARALPAVLKTALLTQLPAQDRTSLT